MPTARTVSIGAVAHQTRKNKTSGPPKKTKKSKNPKPSKKKAKKNEKEETEQEQRQQIELDMLLKRLKENKTLDDINIGKWDNKLDKMQQDEKSDDEYSDEPKFAEKTSLEKKKKKKDKTNEPITEKQKLKKYQVDREDYMQQCANADEKPVFYEEYTPTHFSTFFGIEKTGWSHSASKTFQHLVQYTNEVMEEYEPPTMDHFSELLTKSPKLRRTSPYTNFCFNPIQAIRAWTLLNNIAQNKTAEELRQFIDGWTLPLHMPHDMHLRRKTSTFYGGKSKRAAVQHHCFATDSDGFYSCYRIDEEVSLSTHGMVRYVVPENSAPNWRASIAVVSAMDCSFYWKTTHPATILDNWKFVDGKKKSRCTVISAKADFRMKNEMFRLESHVEGVHLLIFVEDAANAMNPKSLPSNIVDLVYESERWEQKVNEQIYLPKCTTSLPISLYDHSKHHGLNRLFSSEKSELGSMKTSKFDGSSAPNFVTLFDHYHKTVFDILPNPPNKTGLKKRQFDVLAPGKAHQCIEDSMAKLFGKFQDETSASTDPFFTYYEDHLHQNPGSLDYVDDKTAFDTGAPGINLAKPFYYVMSRKFEDNFMIVCGGYFNNTIWANKA